MQVKDFYYTLTAGFDGSEDLSPVSTTTEEESTEENSSDSSGRPSGGDMFGGGMMGGFGDGMMMGGNMFGASFVSGDFSIIGYSSVLQSQEPCPTTRILSWLTSPQATWTAKHSRRLWTSSANWQAKENVLFWSATPLRLLPNVTNGMNL